MSEQDEAAEGDAQEQQPVESEAQPLDAGGAANEARAHDPSAQGDGDPGQVGPGSDPNPAGMHGIGGVEGDASGDDTAAQPQDPGAGPGSAGLSAEEQARLRRADPKERRRFASRNGNRG